MVILSLIICKSIFFKYMFGKMPRKQTNPKQIITKQDSVIIKSEDNSKDFDDKIKLEQKFKNEKQEELSNAQENDTKVDLNIFKYQKKPTVKIEFENDDTFKSEEAASGLWEPLHWKMFLGNLRVMRSNNDAPVDSMGCHMTMDENATPKVIRYQTLISLMLSSQTKDQVTFAAMERLKERGLTVDNVLAMDDEELGKLIYPVGFWKTKVKYIKKTTQTLKEQYDGDIPDSVEKLCKLTGVGPKMAHICMKVAWDKVTGIGVDTHVHRISNRIGWVKKTTATPEDTRKALESWLPFELWSEVNHLMVGFGQTICLPLGPHCDKCLNKNICPSSGKLKRSPNKKSPLKKVFKGQNVVESKLEVKKELLEDAPQSLQNVNYLNSTSNNNMSDYQDITDNVSDSSIQQKQEVSQTTEAEQKRISPPDSKPLKRKPQQKKDVENKDSKLNKKSLQLKKKKT